MMARIASAAVIVGALLLAGCDGSTSGGAASPSSGPSRSGSSRSRSAPRVFPPEPHAPARQFVVSIGDSYAAGYQPTAAGVGRTTRHGFAYQVVDQARTKGYRYRLVNFGCSGATTGSILHSAGCPARLLGPGGRRYPGQTQVGAATAFLRSHRDGTGLITVSIGGNDIIGCGVAPDTVNCLTAALRTVTTNLTTTLRRVRAAAGSTARIVGITYPDVLLGEAVSTEQSRRSLARLSVFAFRSLINPGLRRAYDSVGARFVDVTAASGGYGSFAKHTTLPPYGTVPVPVAKICTLTYYCQFHDIHPRTSGYALIAKVIVATLPQP